MAITVGFDHVGLTVGDLANSVDFFVEALGWTVFGERPDYPATYLTDGVAKLTLWQALTRTHIPFDRKTNIGLHHLALKVPTREKLDDLFRKVVDWPGVEVEFAPVMSGNGPKWHFMINEPGGCRLEVCYDPR